MRACLWRRQGSTAERPELRYDLWLSHLRGVPSHCRRRFVSYGAFAEVKVWGAPSVIASMRVFDLGPVETGQAALMTPMRAWDPNYPPRRARSDQAFAFVGPAVRFRRIRHEIMNLESEPCWIRTSDPLLKRYLKRRSTYVHILPNTSSPQDKFVP